MPRIFKFTSGPNDWQSLLADPVKQWRKGFSARTLAYCWEAADGFPPEVAVALSKATDPLLGNLTPILAIPEFKVSLPGGDRASQNDIFVLAQSAFGPVSIMVEGKVRESFGPTLDEWLIDASPGKKKRLNFLLNTLDLDSSLTGIIRYQLLHRAASAIITGQQYRAVAAVILIHSFCKDLSGWSDYQIFARVFGTEPEIGVVQCLNDSLSVPLFGVWVSGDRSFLER